MGDSAASRKSQRQAVEEQFLDAAERLLIEVGYAGISTRRLADEAGANHGLVHYYFGSMEELFLRVLERFTANGNTVVFSSHVMEVVERLCDRVAIMHQGRLVAEGPTDELRAGRRLEDVFVELVGAGEADVSQLDWLGARRAPLSPPVPPAGP